MINGTCKRIKYLGLIPTNLRLNKYYIIGYVNWTWTLTTVLIPFFVLLFFTISIFAGLRKVKRNLNRHKRLETRAKLKRVVLTNVDKNKEPSCTIEVKVTNENGVGKYNVHLPRINLEFILDALHSIYCAENPQRS